MLLRERHGRKIKNLRPVKGRRLRLRGTTLIHPGFRRTFWLLPAPASSSTAQRTPGTTRRLFLACLTNPKFAPEPSGPRLARYVGLTSPPTHMEVSTSRLGLTQPGRKSGALLSRGRLRGEFILPSYRFAPTTGSLEKRFGTTTPLHSLCIYLQIIKNSRAACQGFSRSYS